MEAQPTKARGVGEGGAGGARPPHFKIRGAQTMLGPPTFSHQKDDFFKVFRGI